MCRRSIEINPAACASTSEGNIPPQTAVSTQQTSALILGSGEGSIEISEQALTHQDQTCEEKAWNVYLHVKPLFYDLCRMLADS